MFQKENEISAALAGERLRSSEMMGFGIIVTQPQTFLLCLDGCPGAKAWSQDAEDTSRGRAGMQL